MADDRHNSMAFVTPRVASKCDLLPHPPSIPTPLPSMPHWSPSCPAHPPESIRSDGSIFVDHCQCFTTCRSHCIKTHHNTPCFLNAARTCLAYVCLLALLCPCAFFRCDLLACMIHLILPPTAFPNHIPPCQPALHPAFHTPRSRSLQQPRTLDGGRRARSFLGGVVSASRYASTRWKCGRRGSVLPNVVLRSVQVSVLLVLLRHRGDGGCKL